MRADCLGAVARREEREPQLGEVGARLVQRPRDRPRIAGNSGVAGGDQTDEPDGERFAQDLDRR
jgi:hypothetical protein